MADGPYYLVVVPDSGSSSCDAHAELTDLVAALRQAVNQGDCAVYVFRGERFELSEEPRHLLYSDGPIPLFDPPAQLVPAASAFVPSRNFTSPFAANTPKSQPAAPITSPALPSWDDEDEFDDEDDE